MIPKLKKLLVFMLLSMTPFFSGCGSLEASKKIAKVINDPKIQVGEAEEQPSEIALHTYAAADANRGSDGQPTPIVLKFFALSSDHRLFSYDFFSLVDEPEKTLGITMVEFLGESLVEPDSYIILGPYELPPRTRRIGVIAEFSDIETTVWRTSISVDAIGADDRLLLLVLEEEVRLISEAQ